MRQIPDRARLVGALNYSVYNPAVIKETADFFNIDYSTKAKTQLGALNDFVTALMLFLN